MTLARLQSLCRAIMNTADNYGVLFTSVTLDDAQWRALDNETRNPEHPHHALVRSRKFQVFRVTVQ